MTEPDPLIRRLERNAVVFCLVAAGVAVAARGGAADVAISVLAGGALIAASYWTIKSSLDGFMRAIGGMPGRPAAAASPPRATDPAETPPPPHRAHHARRGPRPGPATARIHKGKLVFALATFVGRYALLALVAYVMIARLRLHPLGLIVGASSIVAAAGIEATRTFFRAP